MGGSVRRYVTEQAEEAGEAEMQKDKRIEVLLESLILAQDERWRHA